MDYLKTYLEYVKAMTSMKHSVHSMAEDAECAIRDLAEYVALAKSLLTDMSLDKFPLLSKDIESSIMSCETGAYPEYRLKNTVDTLKQAIYLSDDINALLSDHHDISLHVKGWERFFSFSSASDILAFLTSRRAEIQALIEQRSREAMLAAQRQLEDQEHQRQQAIEDAKHSRVAREQLSREEKKRLAQEQFVRSIKIRKKR